MKVRYDENYAKVVETAVMHEFGCELKDIVSVSDTLHKKVVVYFLYVHAGFHEREIGYAYSMTWLFVPTVADRIEWDAINNNEFRQKINNIINLLSHEQSTGSTAGYN